MGDHIRGMSPPLTLTLNGEARLLAAPITLAALLADLGLDTRKVAVERNETIVPRSAYGEVWLAAGDALEIVHFIGGG
jgi:thiamine biosynthesis protein ThiS